MPAAVRSRLPALLGLRPLALEFWVELALAGPGRHARTAALAALLLRRDRGRRCVGGPARAAGRRRSSSSARSRCCPRSRATYYDELLLPFATPFVAAYWLGAHAGRAQLAAGLALGDALGLLATVPYDDDVGAHRAGSSRSWSRSARRCWSAACCAAAPRCNRALREKAALLERRRADAAGRAVVDERTRIAGELHDVVAHALSAMTVQATGARRLDADAAGARARRVRRDRDAPGARRSTSCAGCSACCAARTPS